MEYLLSTFRATDFRNTPRVLIVAAALSIVFLLSALVLRAQPIAHFVSSGFSRSAPAVAELPTVPNTGAASAGKVAKGAMISFTFDNGFESAYLKALPIFEAAGLKTTQYIITDRIGYQGYVNAAQIRSMSKRGHEIGAQSETYRTLTQISEAEVRDEVESSYQDLHDAKLPVATFAYPYGESDASMESAVQAAGFIGARDLGNGFNTPSSDVYNLASFEVRSDTTFADIKTAIDTAAKDKEWLILAFYRVDESAKDGRNVSSTLLKQIVNYVKATRLPVVTVEEGLSG